MVKRRRKKLHPRSFLPTAELDKILKAEAIARGMTYSQLIRHALIEWALYHQVKGAAEMRMAAERAAAQAAAQRGGAK